MAGINIKPTKRSLAGRAVDERIHAALNALVPEGTSTQFGVAGQVGTGGIGGGGSEDPLLPDDSGIVRVSLTVPNNSTANLTLSPKVEYGGWFMDCYWKRGVNYGTYNFDGHRTAAAAYIKPRAGQNPGWNLAGFAGAISGDNVVLTFAADNSGSDISLRLLIRYLPFIA